MNFQDKYVLSLYCNFLLNQFRGKKKSDVHFFYFKIDVNLIRKMNLKIKKFFELYYEIFNGKFLTAMYLFEIINPNT